MRTNSHLTIKKKNNDHPLLFSVIRDSVKHVDVFPKGTNMSFSGKFLRTVMLISLLTAAVPGHMYAYSIAGEGVTPRYTSKASSAPEFPTGSSAGSIGVEASDLTLQQIEDSKGAWAWIDHDNDGVAERYYLIRPNVYITNGITPDGRTVNEYGQWTVDGMIMHRMAYDQNAVHAAIQRAAVLHGNSFDGIYSGIIDTTEKKVTGKRATKTGMKEVIQTVPTKEYLTVTVAQKSVTELSITVSDDEGATTTDYEYEGLNTLHNGVTMWKPKKGKTGDYLLFYGYNSIVYYNYDGTLAGQLMKIS